MSDNPENQAYVQRLIDLEKFIGDVPAEELRRRHALELLDSAHIDVEVRKLASRVLTDFEVNGDSYGVPGVIGIVETLVKKIEEKS